MIDHESYRPTRAGVDLDALVHNLHAVRAQLPKEAGVMAMVKADAYGHGAVPVARVLRDADVQAFGVATVEEGVELRKADISLPIVIMGGLMGAGAPAAERMIEADLTPVLHSAGGLATVEAAAKKADRTVSVHLKIDTGMSRLGLRPEALPSFLDALAHASHIEIEGVMTHLADAGEEKVCVEQLESFAAARAFIEEALGPVRIWHAANSTAVFHQSAVAFAGAAEIWVRPGLALYGDNTGFHECAELKPVLSLVSTVALLKRVPEGTHVSYAGTFTTARASRLAVVPIGYADGYPWSASGRAQVLVRGKRLPVVGRVTMDMIVVDVTDLPEVHVGDEVVLLGEQGDDAIVLSELADWAGTITYEILTRISKRMPRVYAGALE